MEAVVDTSVLRGLLLAEDPLHEAATLLARGYKALRVPSIVVHELAWGLRRSLGWRRARAVLEIVLSDPVYRYEPVLREDAWLASRDPRRYEDLLVVAVAARLGLPLLTLDTDMAKLARRHGVEVPTPRREGN